MHREKAITGVEDDRADRLIAATAIDRNVFVIAGAGTGKTCLLTARLCYSLMWRAFEAVRHQRPPQVATRDVVAITFTEKAAAEMKDRARRYLQAWLHPGTVGGPDAPFIETVRTHLLRQLGENERTWQAVLRPVLAHLNEVRISTIHSFCASILRNYAFEAQIPPHFEVVDENTWRHILQEEWNQYLFDLFGYRPRRDVLHREARRALAWFIRRHHLDLETLFDMAATVARSVVIQGTDLDQQAIWESRAWTAYLHRIRERGLLLTLLATLNASPSRRKREMRTFTAYLVEFLERLLHQEDRPRSTPPPDLNDRWRELFQSTRIRQAIASRADDLPEVEVPSFGTLFRYFLFAIEPRLTRVLAQAFRPLMERLAQRLRREGIFTYDDLLWRTFHLLNRNRMVRQSLQAQCTHLLVDEFQDTNPVQIEILRLLGRDVTTDTWRPGAIFVVGDPKQSIYAFRDADLAAFQRFYDELNEDPRFLSVVLTTNFRSGLAILDFVNTACAPLFAEDRSRYPMEAHETWQKRYGLLTDGDQAPDVSPITAFIRQTVIYPGRYVQPQYHPITPQTSARSADPPTLICLEHADNRDDQWARTVAYEVMRWATDPSHRVNGEPGWGRIGVLFRSMANPERIGRLARTFHAMGIPFVIEGDRNYFQKPEVLDVLNLLRVWVNPYDRPALLGWLRSPIVGISDNFLFHLVGWEQERDPEGPVWPPTDSDAVAILQAADLDVWHRHRVSFLKRFPHLNAEWDRTVRALTRLRDHRETFRQATPAQVLVTLFETFAIPQAYAHHPEGPQRVQNLWKMVELAYRWMDQGDTTVERFAHRVQNLARTGGEEGEGLLADPELNACRWMSIHKAKGLEFDMVILADAHFLIDTHRGHEGEKPCLVESTPDGRVGVAVQRGAVGRPLCNMTFFLQRLRRTQLEEAETKRLFYVACTRARERLVLLCTYGRARKKTGPCRLYRALTHQAPNLPTYMQFQSITPSPIQPTPSIRPPTISFDANLQTHYEQVWARIRKRWERFQEAAPLQQRPSDRDRIPEAIPWGPEDLEEPGCLMHPALSIPPVERSEIESPLGRWVGTLVHEVLARIPLNADDDVRWMRAFLAQEAPRILQPSFTAGLLTWDQIETILTQTHDLLVPFLQSPLWRHIKPRIRAREIPFLHPVDTRGQRFWEGRIDVVFEEPQPQGSILWVADYKTDAESDPRRLVRLYRPQVEVYQSYIQTVFPGRDVRGALILIRSCRMEPIHPFRQQSERNRRHPGLVKPVS